MKNKNITLILSIIIGLGPFSVDLYLPAFPELKDIFGSSFSMVQLTLSSYLVGFALFHLICGPLSDRFGRKPVLLSGIICYTAISFLCAFANKIETLIALRFLQGICVCVAPVLCRAIIRDLYSGNELIKNLATLSAFMAIAPIIAPSLGSVILLIGSWQWHFLCLGFIGLFCSFLVLFFIDETLGVKQSFNINTLSNNIITLVKDKNYMLNIIFNSLIYSPLFAFLSVSGFILINYFNLTPLNFGMYFTGMVLGFMVGNFYIVKRGFDKNWQRIFTIANILTFMSGLLMLLLFYLWHHPLAVIIPMFLATFSIGLVLPKSMGLALERYPHMAGTASALMGFLQMLIASLIGIIAGLTLKSNALPLALIILSCSFLSMITLIKLKSVKRRIIKI